MQPPAHPDRTMHDDSPLARRLAALERRQRALVAALVLVSSTLLVGMRGTDEVLRVKGIVVLDAAGRERIVLGAAGAAPSLPALAQGMTGVLVLDSLGRTAVALGQDPPAVADGKVVRRIARHQGVNVYDPRTGDERGGLGAFANGGTNMCLDYATGKEAVCAIAAPSDEYGALMVNGTPNEKQFDRAGIFVGRDGSAVVKAWGGGTTHTGGVQLEAGEGPARVRLYDPRGKVRREVVAP